MNARYLLDSWAFLALVNCEEPAASRVRTLLLSAVAGDAVLFMSLINLGEVYYTAGRRYGQAAAQEALDQTEKAPINLYPVYKRQIITAATYKINHRLSYADAFALAAAKELDAILLTGDPELFALDGEIQMERLHRAPSN